MTSLGATVTLAELSRDPYPVFARLRAHEPVSWIDELQMWYVTRYDDVQVVLADPQRFSTESETSPVFTAFGVNMLTSDGKEQQRYRGQFRGAFAPATVKRNMEAAIHESAAALVEGLAPRGRAEMRSEFAARLPVLTILSVFGMPASEEPRLRQWYDSFERALSDFQGDATVRAAASASATAFGELLQRYIEAETGSSGSNLLAEVVNKPAAERLSDDEIKRNALVIFFGGISTVEALILNSIHALFAHPQVLARVRANLGLLSAVLEEVMRWMSPVQSAMRHATVDTTLRGVSIRAGDTVSCMLGAANRDPVMFADPDRFDIDRSNARKHLGFAYGPHACLGLHLAKLEARIALEVLLRRLQGVELTPGEPVIVEGHEFRQPRRLVLRWTGVASTASPS